MRKAAVVCLVVLVVWCLLVPSSLPWLINAVHANWLGIIGAGGLLIAVGASFLLVAGDPWKELRSWLVGGFIVAVLFGVLQLSVRPYLNLKYIWETSGTVVPQDASFHSKGYAVRSIPYEVAVNSITQRAGYFPGTEVRNVTYIPDNGSWTAIANGGGFRETTGIISLNADQTLEVCEVSVPAIGGWFGNSLKSRIHQQAFRVSIDTDDAYGICEKGVGTVYVPIRKLHGLTARLQPAGVVEVSAEGVVTMHSDFGLSQLPGPTYPSSVVRLQEQSINTTQGFWKFFTRQAAVQVVADEGDPNYGNPGQFLLVTVGDFGGNGEYVSQLVPQGGIRSIAMRSSVSAVQLPSSRYNDIAFVAFDKNGQHTGNKAVADTVMLVVPPEERTSLSVWEVVPSFGARRVAYVGRPTQVEYLVWVDSEGVVINVERVNQPDFMIVDEGEVDWTNVSDEEFEEYFEEVLGEFLNRKNR